MKPYETKLSKVIKSKMIEQNNELKNTYLETSFTKDYFNRPPHNISKPEYERSYAKSMSPFKNQHLRERSLASFSKNGVALFNSSITGTSCINPLSEKEDLQMRMAYVTLKQLQDRYEYDSTYVQQRQQQHFEGRNTIQLGDQKLSNTYGFDLNEEDQYTYRQVKVRELSMDQQIGMGNTQSNMQGRMPKRDPPIHQRINSILISQKEQMKKQREQYLNHQQSINVNNSYIPNSNPYLVTITEDFMGQQKVQNTQDLLNSTLFRYDHKQLVPRSTFFTIKKDQYNSYKQNILNGGELDDLMVNQAKIDHKYPYKRNQFHINVKDDPKGATQIKLAFNLNHTFDSAIKSPNLQIDSGTVENKSIEQSKRVILSKSPKNNKSPHVTSQSQFETSLKPQIIINNKLKQIKNLKSSNQSLLKDNADTINLTSNRDSKIRVQEKNSSQLLKLNITYQNPKFRGESSPPIPAEVKSTTDILQDQLQQQILSTSKQNLSKQEQLKSINSQSFVFFPTELQPQQQQIIENNNTSPRIGEIQQTNGSSSMAGMQSPLRNSKLSHALNGGSLMQSLENLQVRNKEEEICQKKTNKGNKIFEQSGIQNTKDFLQTYFKKEPQLFENMRMKQRMAKVRKEVSYLERHQFSSTQYATGSDPVSQQHFLLPDAPLLSFYTTGKYDKPVGFQQYKQPSALPVTIDIAIINFQGYSATINERNRSPFEEIDIKPITQKAPEKRYYDPNRYLKPFDERNTIDAHKDVNMNSISYNRIANKKRQIEESKTINYDGVPVGSSLDKNDFIRKRQSQGSPDILRMSGSGKLVAEKILQASRDEQEYFKSKKIFTKETEQSNYKRQIPDYMRVLDKPNNQSKLQDSPDGMVSIVSKNQGWITVTPRSLNRKKPLEKGGIGDVTKTSILTPSWMQINYPKNTTDFMKGTCQGGLRQENNRTFLTDKDQPKKSIFNVGNFRHNVAFKDQVEQYQAQVQEPVRLIEWKESTDKQKYDGKLTNKIGSFHESSSQKLY